MADYETELDEYRQKLKRIDAQILSLIGRRMGWAQEIGSIKNEHGLAIEVEDKEQNVYDHWRRRFEEQGLRGETGEAIAELLLDESKYVQKEYS